MIRQGPLNHHARSDRGILASVSHHRLKGKDCLQYAWWPLALPGSFLQPSWAPTMFQRMMEILLHPHQTYAAAYLDDVVIHSESWEEHLNRL